MIKKDVPIPARQIEGCIHTIHGASVMFDQGLAALYGVTVKALNQAVKQNVERFPGDFAGMFICGSLYMLKGFRR